MSASISPGTKEDEFWPATPTTMDMAKAAVVVVLARRVENFMMNWIGEH